MEAEIRQVINAMIIEKLRVFVNSSRDRKRIELQPFLKVPYENRQMTRAVATVLEQSKLFSMQSMQQCFIDTQAGLVRHAMVNGNRALLLQMAAAIVISLTDAVSSSAVEQYVRIAARMSECSRRMDVLENFTHVLGEHTRKMCCCTEQ